MKKLVAYISSSFPDKNFTIDLALQLKESGVDSLELGIPFSDPVADGPIIEKANHLALQNGFKMNDIFEISNKISNDIDTLLMGYFNPFYQYGIENFVKKAKELNINGFIIPDLPYEETLIYKDLFNKNNIALIDFIAPTTPKDRMEQIIKSSNKFIYLVAYAGITGSNQSEDLTDLIKNIKSKTDTDIFLGFGVNGKNAKEKVNGVDGVIVGSAFVKYLLDDDLTNIAKIGKISQLAKEIKEKINS